MRAILLLVLVLVACDGGGDRAGTLDLAGLRGQWVVVNYWAEWCKPCRLEIPELNRLAEQYPEVTVLGVNYDGAVGEDLERQLRELGIAFPTLSTDPAAGLGVPRPGVLPTTLILNPRGKLSATLTGPQTLSSLTQATAQAAE